MKIDLSSEKHRVLIAVLLSILLHVIVAMLGSYAPGKPSSNSLSVKITGDIYKPPKQAQLPITENKTNLAPAKKPVKNAQKTPVAEEVIVSIKDKNPIINEQTQTLKTATITKATLTITKKTAADKQPTKTLAPDKATISYAATNTTIRQQETKQKPNLATAKNLAPVAKSTVDAKTKTAASGSQNRGSGLLGVVPIVSAMPLYHLIPKPPYPVRSRDLGEEGTVIVAVKVAADGSVAEARISKTSGYTLLDGSALSSIKSQWRFKPARRGGDPVDAWVRVPITFSIEK